MKIGIIGAGMVGGTLGRRFAEAGNEVWFGVPDPTDAKHQELGAVGKVGTVPEAASNGDVLVVAVPYAALPSVAEEIKRYPGKIVLDCSNPINASFTGVASNSGTSAAEELVKASGNVSVVKIFNTVGFNVMANPSYDGRKAAMLYAGDDTMAKEVAKGLASSIGFEPIDAGPLSQAKWLEAFAWLWISMAMKQGHGRQFAFGYLNRGE